MPSVKNFTACAKKRFLRLCNKVSYTDLPEANRQVLQREAQKLFNSVAQVQTSRTLRMRDFDTIMNGLLNLTSLTCLYAKGLRDHNNEVTPLSEQDSSLDAREKHLSSAEMTAAENEAEEAMQTDGHGSGVEEDDLGFQVLANIIEWLKQAHREESNNNKLWKRLVHRNGRVQCRCRLVLKLFKMQRLFDRCQDPETGLVPSYLAIEHLIMLTALCKKSLESLMRKKFPAPALGDRSLRSSAVVDTLLPSEGKSSSPVLDIKEVATGTESRHDSIGGVLEDTSSLSTSDHQAIAAPDRVQHHRVGFQGGSSTKEERYLAAQQQVAFAEASKRSFSLP